MISVYRSSERLPFSLGEKRKLRAARGSGITATIHTLRARLQSSFSGTSGGRARRARRALVRATLSHVETKIYFIFGAPLGRQRGSSGTPLWGALRAAGQATSGKSNLWWLRARRALVCGWLATHLLPRARAFTCFAPTI